MQDEILDRLKSIKSYDDVYKVPRSIFMGTKLSKVPLKIAFVVNSCFGFGDVIFTYKLLLLFKKWYNVSPIVFTTKPELFVNIGVPKKQLVRLAVPGEPLDETCDWLVEAMVPYHFDTVRKRYKADLDCVFVTPWVGNNDTVDVKALQGIFPNANRFNTFVFSAYNRVAKNEGSPFDFDLGLNELGLLYYRQECGKRPIKNPYVISYVSDVEVDGLGCLEKFVKRVIKKYSGVHDKLEILVPKSITQDNRLDKLVRFIEKYDYQVLVSQSKAETKQAHTKRGRYILFRADISGVPYRKYLDYICNALPDILVTGNQSVSDILACCPKFNIFYQIMPWEKKFAKELGKLTGVKDLGVGSKSCGHTGQTELKGIHTKHDFEKKGKMYVDAVLKSVLEAKTDVFLKEFQEAVHKSRKVSTLIKKISRGF